MASQLPVPVLLDAHGIPFSQSPLGAYSTGQPSTDPYSGPTLILVDPGGGQVRLTDRDADFRAMPYADIQATQGPVAAVIGGMMRRGAIIKRRVYRRPKRGKSQNGKPKQPEVDENNTLHDLLCNPAPGFGAMSLNEWQALPFYVNGNSLLVKFRAGGEEPTEIFPLDWRYSQAWARLGTPVIMWGTVQTGEWVWIRPSEVVHTMWASVAGPQGAWLGTSPLAQLGVTIKIDEAAAAFAASRFNNASRPGGVVSLPANVNVQQVPEYTTRARDSIEGAYRGEDKAFRAAVLAGGATWQPWQTGNDEAQLTETRQHDSMEMCAVYGQPWAAYFGTSPATPENDAQAWKALMPWQYAMDDRLNAQLVYPEPVWKDLFIASDFDEQLFGDPLVLSDKMSTEYEVGLRKLNEARHKLGLNPVKGGDKFISEMVQDNPELGPNGKPLPEQEQVLASARTATALERL